MKDYTVVRRVIEKLISDNYTGNLKLIFENTFLEATNVEHITIIDEGDTYVESMELGGNISRNAGMIVLGIFTALGEGTNKARSVANALDIIFDKEVPGISFGEREFRVIGADESSPLYQHSFIVPYQHFYGQEDST